MSTNGTEHGLRSRGSYVVFVGLEIERERERKKPVTSFLERGNALWERSGTQI